MARVFSDGPPLLYLAVGKRKDAKQRFSMATLDEITQAMRSLPRDISLKYQLRALRKAAKPGQEALRSQVSSIRQVTGNLVASVTKAERKYTNNRAQLPVSVIVVGFRRPTGQGSQKGATPAFEGGTVLKGPNRAYHSHLVEYGTKPRTAGKSTRLGRKRVIVGGRVNTIFLRGKAIASPRAILSSFKTRGRFSGPGRGQYPKDFIARGTVAGSPAKRPLAKAFQASRSQMQSILDVEMRKALTAAVRKIGRDIKTRAEQ